MKFSLVNFIYLFFRLSPYIIVSFFLLQFVFNHDFIAVVYFIGLILTIIITFGIGWIIKSLAFFGNSMKSKKQICNIFNIGFDENRFSYLLLNPVVLGFSFFFFTMTVIKHAGSKIDWTKPRDTSDETKIRPSIDVTNDFLKQNIPLFIILPTLILGDMFISVYNDCDIPLKLLFSLAVGSSCGIATAVIGDYYLRGHNDHGPGVCGTNKACDANRIDAIYSTKAKAGSIDLSLYNIFNNPTCDQPYKGFYKCRMVSQNTKTPTVTSVADNLINELNTISNTNLEKSGLYAYSFVTINIDTTNKYIQPNIKDVNAWNMRKKIEGTYTNEYITVSAEKSKDIKITRADTRFYENINKIYSPTHTNKTKYTTPFVDEYRSTDGNIWIKFCDGTKENQLKYGITLNSGNAFWLIMSDDYYKLMG